MKYRIETLPQTILMGMRTRMSYLDVQTPQLWQAFMSKRTEIKGRLDENYYSVEVYDDRSYFEVFDPSKTFEKWATVHVSSETPVPEGMEKLVVPEGEYVVFSYKGSSQEASKAYQYIYSEWIPQSPYRIAHRPHFALMGERYKNNDPNSEEEFWIPITKP